MGVRGRLITFEGSEGSGKSTQMALIQRYLESSSLKSLKRKRKVLSLREPGATKIGEKIRRILLDVQNVRMSDRCETLLYMAARAQLVHEKIIPALRKGVIVLCDRFLDSTVTYQGYGSGVDVGWIRQIAGYPLAGITPDLTLVFDIEPRAGLQRIQGPKDRIERRSVLYHNRVRQGYLALAHQEPERIKVINVNGDKQEIHLLVRRLVDNLLD